MKRILAIVLVLAMLFVSAGSVSFAEEAESVLHLTYGVNSFNSYDFFYPWNTNTDTLIKNLMYMTLIQADKDLNAAEGEIMKEWTASEDGLTFTFTMNEDLCWSDGEPIKMEDIIWTFERLCAYDYWSYVSSALKYIEGYNEFREGTADTVSGITAEGNVLTIKLSSPYASFLNLMAQVAPLPKHIYGACTFEGDSFKTDPIWRTVDVTSGMFVVTEHVEDNYFVLEPNPYYKGEMPQFTKVICTKTADNVVNAQEGSTDLVFTNSVDAYTILSDLEGYSLNKVPIIFFRFLMFNFFDSEGTPKDFVSDLRVRQAFAYAIDWESVISSLFGELASLTQTGVLSNDENYVGDWYSYDPEKAKALLDEAGFDYDHTLKIFYYYTDQATIDLMDAICYYLGEIGVKCEAVFTDNDTEDVLKGRTHDIAYYGLSAYDNLSWYQMYMRDTFDGLIDSQEEYAAPVAALESAYNDELWAEAITTLQELEKETVYLLPVYTLEYQVWNNARLQLPEDCFGNPWYYYDYQVEDWVLEG